MGMKFSWRKHNSPQEPQTLTPNEGKGQASDIAAQKAKVGHTTFENYLYVPQKKYRAMDGRTDLGVVSSACSVQSQSSFLTKHFLLIEESSFWYS